MDTEISMKHVARRKIPPIEKAPLPTGDSVPSAQQPMIRNEPGRPRRTDCDDLILGAGAGGLSLALLLARAGRRVILVERSPHPGGALNSFPFQGSQLDAGFHFTGALQPGGLFDDILRALRLRDRIRPIPLDPDRANHFVFTAADREIPFPYGIPRLTDALHRAFPGERDAIGRFFATAERVAAATPSLRFSTLDQQPHPIPEDEVTLQDYLDDITRDPLLKGTLSALVMCHGSAPSEITLGDHLRLCQGFHEQIATLDGGGASLVHAMLDELRDLDVEIICEEKLVSFSDIRDQRIHRFVLHSGRELVADHCISTLHPKTLAALLPREAFPPAFFRRIADFVDTPGFFTVFARLDGPPDPAAARSIVSLYPENDINRLSLLRPPGPGALAILHAPTPAADGSTVITAFEPMYWQDVAQWSDSRTGQRPPDYQAWKEAKTREIHNRILAFFPGYRGRLALITAASPLTYRDHLHCHHGCAYGIKHRPGQFNLLGPTRLRNLHAAGQSAILPGVLGTIVASLMVGRMILGENVFRKFIDGRL
jgi:phytoene dehydrogenase-like protein